MSGLRPDLHPATILFGFVGLLLASVAALVAWPFSQPLLWLFFALLAVFFAFSALVIAFSFAVLVQTLRASTRPGRFGKLRGSGAVVPGSELWDDWLDGVRPRSAAG